MRQVTIRVGSREVVVDNAPLSAGASNFRTHVLVEPRARQLVLRPSAGYRLIAAVFAVVGGVALVIAGVLWSQHGPQIGCWVPAGFGLIFLAAGLLLWFLPRRHTFDADEGQMTTSGLFGSSSRPLTDVLAVQLLPGGWHTSSSDQHGSSSSYYTYQLNLVLDDDRTPRRNLLNHTHWESIGDAGRRLADLLGVPLLDLVSEEEAK
jgi:hypothetical protein